MQSGVDPECNLSCEQRLRETRSPATLQQGRRAVHPYTAGVWGRRPAGAEGKEAGHSVREEAILQCHKEGARMGMRGLDREGFEPSGPLYKAWVFLRVMALLM